MKFKKNVALNTWNLHEEMNYSTNIFLKKNMYLKNNFLPKILVRKINIVNRILDGVWFFCDEQESQEIVYLIKNIINVVYFYIIQGLTVLSIKYILKQKVSIINTKHESNIRSPGIHY